MKSFSCIAMLGLALTPMAAMSAELAEASPEPTELLLEFHPLHQHAASKAAGNSLKPKLPPAEFMPVEMSLKMHRHTDGRVSYRCDADHSALTFVKPDLATAAEPQP